MVEAGSTDINSISFSAWVVPSNSLVECVLQMITELNIIKEYKLRKDIIKDLIKSIQSAYNQNPFHCWLHAVSVTQMMYLFISKTSLAKILATRVCLFIFMYYL